MENARLRPEALMGVRFRDRSDAGRQLAQRLGRYAHRPDVLVLALPRGGVPVAFEVARALQAPLDVFLVRKLGLPGHEELAMGAIASGGVRVLNDEVVDGLAISDWMLDVVTARELQELARRETLYRGGRAPTVVRGRTIILVDDGIATGSTVRAAIKTLRQRRAERIVVAAPTIAAGTAETLRGEVDELVAVVMPENFFGVGQWYADFSQTSDAEVCELLQRAGESRRGPTT